MKSKFYSIRLTSLKKRFIVFHFIVFFLLAFVPGRTIAQVCPGDTQSPSFIPPPIIPELLYYKFDGTGTSVPNLASAPPPGTATGILSGSMTQGAPGICGSGSLIGNPVAGVNGNYLNTNWSNYTLPASWTISFKTANCTPGPSDATYIFGSATGISCYNGSFFGGYDYWRLQLAGIGPVSVPGAGAGPHITTFVLNRPAGVVKGYLDGVLVSSLNIINPNANISSTWPFLVGAASSEGGEYTLSGHMDEFSLFNRALSDAEIARLAGCQTESTCPAPIIVNNDPGVCGATVSYTVPVAYDNCSVTVTQTAGLPGGSIFPIGTTTNIFTATDPSGNTATCSFDVTVNDTEAPVINCLPDITVNNSPGQCGANVTFAAPTASDNCASVTVTSSHASGSFFSIGTTTVTSTATDAPGNTTTCTFTVTVNDTQAPVITCPANITVNNTSGQCGANVNYTPPTATDNCSGVTVTSSHASGSFFPIGTTTVTSTATDATDNTTTCTFTVTVNDIQAPVIACPANITVNNTSGQCGANVTYTAPTITDNCSGVSVTSSHASGSFFPVGTTTVTSTATDAAGNTTTCTFTATVNDTQAPSVTCPANITVNSGAGQCGANVTFAAPAATDNCTGDIVTSNPASGSFFPAGTNTVTSTATDAAGNTTTCTFTITVNETQAPTITCPANIAVNNTAGQCGANVTYTAPTVTDNCPGVTVTSSHASGSFFPVGTTTVTATATDAAGNTATCTFTVTVNDTQAPVITCPANITVNNTAGQCGANVTFSAPAATDNCSGVTVTTNHASGSFFAVGVTTVTATATDAAGNTSTCTFTITVNDTQAPVITCPSNIVVNSQTGQCGAVVNFAAPAVSDNCPGVGTAVSTPASGSFFPVGITTITSSVTDAAGNVSACTFTVRVNDTQAPTISCPANITTTTTTGTCTRVVDFTVTAADNCGTVNIVSAPASGTAFPIGSTTVNAVATDAAGNTRTCSFTVIVTDSQLPVITTQPVSHAVCEAGSTTFTVIATNAMSYQWQENGTDISGATSATLTLNNVTNAMNGNQYRVIVRGLCTNVTSSAAILTANPLPSITLSASPSAISPGQLATITASYSGTAGTFAWYRNNVLTAVSSSPVLSNLNVDSLGVYKVVFTDVNGCSATSQPLTLKADPNWQFFVYPSPNNGRFQVRFYSYGLGVKRVLNVYDSRGALVFKREVMVTNPYERMDVDVTRYAQGYYHVELRSADGRLLGSGTALYMK